MTHRLVSAAIGAQLLLTTSLSCLAADPLHVFLQGSSAQELSTLVESAGGEITHDLHVIDAVGAKLSEQQLEKVLESPLVIRTINDIADDDIPEDKEDEPPCRVRGHIELDFIPGGISWRLYNKHKAPAQLMSLTLDWPDSLGQIKELSIGDTKFHKSLYATNTDSAATLSFSAANGPIIKNLENLKVLFSAAAPSGTPHPPQRDFKLEATFAGPCSTELVAGYENNDHDFYYNTVGGIDALHLQGITGKGITVAVIDSGLWEHEALRNDTAGANRLIARYDALTNKEDQEVVDESGHGTHMTSIIAHSGKTLKNGKWTGTYKGVAPDANIVAIKVLDREGLAKLLDIVQAVQWVVDNREKHKIRVLNLSFAQTPRWPYWNDPVNQAVIQAWDNGIVVVAAAGNEGPEPMTIGSPGNIPEIITVGAVTDSWTPNTRNDDYVPDFSSQGPTPTGHVKPDIVSLGGHMTGLIRPESAIAQTQPEDILRTGQFVSTGSSQASAFVSGMTALLLQLQPNQTPAELKCRFTTSAELAINADGKLAYSPFQQGYGYVTASRAVLLGAPNCQGPTPADSTAEYDPYGPALVEPDGKPSLPGLNDLVSETPSAKGLSTTRKWGVKDHIESGGSPTPTGKTPVDPIFNWHQLYIEEKSQVDRLSRPPAAEAPNPS